MSAEAGCASAAQSGVSEAVVHLALLRVAQNRIGLGADLELLLGLRIIRVAVRMKLERLLRGRPS